jgi:hypothetical protein
MLADLQAALIRALVADDPWAALARERARLDPSAQAAVDAIEHDGFVLTSLLVKKLRFERLCRGDAALERWFEADPRGFTEAFRAYNREVAPTAYFPTEEARRFRGG